MNSDISYATLGELVKFTFSAFGVMPRKNSDDGDFDETAKKTLNQLLLRLSKEEGKLTENLNKASDTFSQLISSYIPNPGLTIVMHSVLSDLFLNYNHLIINDGTYLSKTESVRFFLEFKALHLFVESLHIHSLQHRALLSELTFPKDKSWYLPTVEADGNITQPLSKTMHWIYEQCGVSQRQFHMPLENGEVETFLLEQNYENASRWSRGKTLPSLVSLLDNFRKSFAYNKFELSPSFIVSAESALLLARLSTFISTSISNEFGSKVLQNLVNKCERYFEYIDEDILEFKNEYHRVLETHTYTPEQKNTVWDYMLSDWENHFFQKKKEVASYLQKKAETNSTPSNAVVDALIQKYGTYSAIVPIELANEQKSRPVDMTFFNYLGKGLELEKDTSLSLSLVKAYREELAEKGLKSSLDWLPFWLEGIVYYRNEDFELAFNAFDTAFHKAKYKAGMKQYKLLNHYVETAAKIDNRRAFNKGLQWAKYIGYEIRWLRDQEQTEENIQLAYTILKRGNYSI